MIFYLINKKIDECLIYKPGTACQKKNSFKKYDGSNRRAKKTIVDRQFYPENSWMIMLGTLREL